MVWVSALVYRHKIMLYLPMFAAFWWVKVPSSYTKAALYAICV